MNTKLKSLALAALILLAGCVPSLNPVYSEADLVFDPQVLGNWVQTGSQDTWQVTRRDEKSYWIVHTDKNGQQGRYVARLARLDGTLFLDLFPADIGSDANGLYKLHLVSIHTIYRVRHTEPQVELGVIDGKWLDQYLNAHPDAIQFATFNGNKLITAPTEDVQAFVLEHKEKFTGTVRFERSVGDVN